MDQKRNDTHTADMMPDSGSEDSAADSASSVLGFLMLVSVPASSDEGWSCLLEGGQQYAKSRISTYLARDIDFPAATFKVGSRRRLAGVTGTSGLQHGISSI